MVDQLSAMGGDCSDTDVFECSIFVTMQNAT